MAVIGVMKAVNEGVINRDWRPVAASAMQRRNVAAMAKSANSSAASASAYQNERWHREMAGENEGGAAWRRKYNEI
jgi:hypothetical protein